MLHQLGLVMLALDGQLGRPRLPRTRQTRPKQGY